MSTQNAAKPLRERGWLTPAEAARTAAVSASTIYRGIRSGDVDAVRYGGRLYVRRDSVLAWLGRRAAELLANDGDRL